jgi:hypothetical protein
MDLKSSALMSLTPFTFKAVYGRKEVRGKKVRKEGGSYFYGIDSL